MKEHFWRENNTKVLLLKANTLAQINIPAQSKSLLAQYIQVQRRKTLSCPGIILIKYHIQTPMELILNRPMLAGCIRKLISIHQRRIFLPNFKYCVPADAFGFYRADGL